MTTPNVILTRAELDAILAALLDWLDSDTRATSEYNDNETNAYLEQEQGRLDEALRIIESKQTG